MLHLSELFAVAVPCVPRPGTSGLCYRLACSLRARSSIGGRPPSTDRLRSHAWRKREPLQLWAPRRVPCALIARNHSRPGPLPIWKPTCPKFSRRATCLTDRSSAVPPLSAEAPRPPRSCSNTSPAADAKETTQCRSPSSRCALCPARTAGRASGQRDHLWWGDPRFARRWLAGWLPAERADYRDGDVAKRRLPFLSPGDRWPILVVGAQARWYAREVYR